MENTQKMVLTNYESETPPLLVPSTDSNVQYSSEIPTQNLSSVKRLRSHQSLERFKNQVIILLKLEKLDSVDNNLRIKNKKGVFIENSNIINLLNNATQNAKELVEQDEFLKLLYQAGVETELILNQNLKSKLFKLYLQTKKTQTSNITEPQIFTQTSPEQSMQVDPVVKSNKRQREEEVVDDDEESYQPAKKRINWIMPENSEEND